MPPESAGTGVGMSPCPGYVPLTGNRTPALGRTEEPRQLSHSSQAPGPRIGRLGACRGDQRSPLCALRSPSLRPAPSCVVATAACPPLAPLGAPLRVQSFPDRPRPTAGGGVRLPPAARPSSPRSSASGPRSVFSPRPWLRSLPGHLQAPGPASPWRRRPGRAAPRLPRGRHLLPALRRPPRDRPLLPGHPRRPAPRRCPRARRLRGQEPLGAHRAVPRAHRGHRGSAGPREGPLPALGPPGPPAGGCSPAPRLCPPRPALLSLLHSSPS